MERLDYNRKILEKLKEYIESYPDLRFGQILRNFDIVKELNITSARGTTEIYWKDDFYLESKETWERMKK